MSGPAGLAPRFQVDSCWRGLSKQRSTQAGACASAFLNRLDSLRGEGWRRAQAAASGSERKFIKRAPTSVSCASWRAAAAASLGRPRTCCKGPAGRRESRPSERQIFGWRRRELSEPIGKGARSRAGRPAESGLRQVGERRRQSGALKRRERGPAPAAPHKKLRRRPRRRAAPRASCRKRRPPADVQLNNFLPFRANSTCVVFNFMVVIVSFFVVVVAAIIFLLSAGSAQVASTN